MTAPNMRTPGEVGTGRALRGNERTDGAIVAPPADRCNGLTFVQVETLAALTAKFAHRGHAVHELPGGGFAVCRWGLSRHCASLEALHAFAVQIGVIEAGQ